MADLPDELWQHTFSFLHLPEGSQCDGVRLRRNSKVLLSISLVNKRFNNLGRPALYHTINVARWYDTERLPSLLRTLYRNPKTCDLVMSLSFDCVRTEHDAEQDRVVLSDPDSEMVEVYDGVLEQLSLSQDLIDRLRAWLWQGLADAQVALLIFMCPRVRGLFMEVPFVPGTNEAMCLDAIRASVLSRRHAIFQRRDKAKARLPFEQLREIGFAHWDTESATDISRVVECMEAPSLETIRLQQFSCCYDDDDLRRMQCNAREIYFNNSLVEAPGFECLLAGCLRLQKLSIHWGDATVSDHWDLDFAGFGSALRRHGRGLVTLELDLTYVLDVFDDAGEGVLGDLSTLQALENLTVPLRALFGNESDGDSTASDDPEIADTSLWLVDNLPTSLKRLRITDASSGQDATLHDARIKELLFDRPHQALDKVEVSRNKPFTHNLDNSDWHSTTEHGICLERRK